VEEPAFLLHLPEQRRTWVRSQDVESGALEAGGIDPLGERREDIPSIAVEANHEAPVYLDAVVVKDADAALVILGTRRALAGGDEVLVVEGLESDEHSGAAGQRHLPHQRVIVGHVERDRGGPDRVERAERGAQPA